MTVMSREAAEKTAKAKIAAAHADIAKICARKGSVVLEIYMADLQRQEVPPALKSETSVLAQKATRTNSYALTSDCQSRQEA